MLIETSIPSIGSISDINDGGVPENKLSESYGVLDLTIYGIKNVLQNYLNSSDHRQ